MAKSSARKRFVKGALIVTAGMYAAAEIVRRLDHNRSGDGERGIPSLPDGKRVDGVVSKDGTPLYVDVCGGSGPTVFFVHGWTCNGTIWRYQKAHFCDKYRVVTLDLRGHGRSGMPESMDYSTDRLAEDLKAVIDAINPEEFAIVGHSLGGFTTFKWHEHYGEQYRERLKGLVIVDSTGVDVVEGMVMGKLIDLFYPTPIAWYLNLFKREIPLFQKIADIYGKTSLAYVLIRLLVFGKKPPANEVEFHRDMTFSTSLSSISLAGKACLDYHVDYHLCDVDVPVLVVAGSLDTLTNEKSNERTCELLPDSRLRIYNDRGHGTLLECPEDLNRDVEEFLQGCF